MRHGVVAVIITSCIVVTGCGGGGDSSGTHPVSLNAVTVTAASSSIDLGFTQQFTATGNYSDGSTRDLSSSATWSTADTTVASVSSSGIVTAKRAGSTTVQASFNGVTGSATATVLPPTVIAVTSPNLSRPAGLTQQFSATATFSEAAMSRRLHPGPRTTRQLPQSVAAGSLQQSKSGPYRSRQSLAE